MKALDLLAMCLRNLTRRKFRTFLTVTGVVIGTCAIVVMISLGVGISSSYDEMLQSMGDLTIITVRQQSSDVAIDDDIVNAIMAMPHVEVASPSWRYDPSGSYMNMVAGRKNRYNAYADLVGINPGDLEKLGYTAQRGTLELGEKNKKIQLVFGPMMPYQFNDSRKRWPNNYIDGWPDENGDQPDPFFDVMAEDITLLVFASNEKAEDLEFDLAVSGIIQGKDNDWDIMYSVYVDIADLKRIRAAYDKENGIKKNRDDVESYDSIKVKVDHIDNVSEIQKSIEGMGFYVQSMEAMRESMQQSTQQIQLILGALGGVSLFVAAISITNTMVMSVYERTREIGVMKVLGCLVNNIRTVFLLEAGLIGFMGGVLGIGTSYLLSYLMNRFGGSIGQSMGMGMVDGGARISIIPLWLVLLGLAFATLIGLVAGFYPANRAVRISALEAIKQE